MEFKQRAVGNRQTIGQRLHEERERQYRSLDQLSGLIQVSPQHLLALEEGRYNDLPSPVYIKNYLRLYCKALSIPWEDMTTLYEQEIRVYASAGPTQSQQRPVVRRRSSSGFSDHFNRRALLIPRMLKYGLAAIGVLLLAVYFAWGLVQLFSPPELDVTSPAGDIMADSSRIEVIGTTVPEAYATINGQAISVQQSGDFQVDVPLQAGVNTITVSSQSKLGRSSTVVRHVLYHPDSTATIPSIPIE